MSPNVSAIIKTPSAETGSKFPASDRSKMMLVITAVEGVKRKTAELSSRSDGMKAVNQVATTLRRSNGNVIRAKVLKVVDPRVRAAFSNSTSMLRNADSLPEYAMGKKRVAKATISIQAVP